MLFKFIVFLIAIGAAVGDSNSCLRRMRSDCLENKELPREFPSTTEGLRRDCENVQNMLRCAKNTFESCPETQKEAREAEIFLNAMDETCNENGNTYEVLSRKISCAGPMMNNIQDVCGPHHEGEEEILRPLRTEENIHVLNCAHQLRKSMCYSIAVSKRCGAAELKDIVTNLLKKFNLEYDKDCTSDVLNQLQPHLDAYENALLRRDF